MSGCGDTFFIDMNKPFVLDDNLSSDKIVISTFCPMPATTVQRRIVGQGARIFQLSSVDHKKIAVVVDLQGAERILLVELLSKYRPCPPQAFLGTGTAAAAGKLVQQIGLSNFS